jgi:CubicO group peptidase (beta-lactamase class C family)
MKASWTIVAAALLAGPVRATAPEAVPATVAVRFDRNGIEPVLAEGFADRQAGRQVTADDPVRIASVSKLVTALGVMRMVDKGQLELDRDVSDYLGWTLRNPAFPERPITLRLLLSHQSSLADGGERYIIPLDLTLRARLAEPEMWDGVHAPGSGWFHYSNINFPVVASVMERVSGERFDRLMVRLVLKPLKLDACFNWGAGCSSSAFGRAVILYRANGEVARDDLQGRPPACPVVPAEDGSCELAGYIPGWNGALFSPHGGLRISMRDLARIGQMLARGGKGFLSPRAYAELTRSHWHFNGRNGLGEYGENDGFFCAFGLAVQRIGTRGEHCRDDLFGDGTARLGHAGEAYGLRSGLWWDPVSGKGLAFFTSAVPDDAPNGRSAFDAVEECVVERATR